jgi:hypothetical protein
MSRSGAWTALAVFVGRELWRRRDKQQVEALWGVALKRPTLYRVTIDRVPALRIEGNDARVVGVTVHGGPGVLVSARGHGSCGEAL